VEAFIDECAAFPNAAHDDQLDAMAQALNRLRSGTTAVYQVAESEILLDRFLIPDHWRRG